MHSYQSKIRIALALILICTQSLFAYKPQTTIWDKRQKTVPRDSFLETRKNHFQLAALPKNSTLPTPLSWPKNVTSINKESTRNKEPGTRNVSKTVEAIPQQFSSIRKIIPGQSNQVVIHIQDVHQNHEAQKNIADTVKALIKTGNIGLLALEGTSDLLEFGHIKNFEDQEAIHTAADYLLKEGHISGPIHAALTTTNNLPHVIGVDDQRLYQANVEAYKKAAPQMHETTKALKRTQNQLKQKKELSFNSDLRKFDVTVQAFRQDQISLGQYVTALSKASEIGFHATIETFLAALELEENLDFDRVEIEQQQLITKLVRKLDQEEVAELMNISSLFKTGQQTQTDFYAQLKKLCYKNKIQLSHYQQLDQYVQYVLMSHQIDTEKLFKDLQELETAIYNKLAQTTWERKLIRESRKNYLSQKLVEFGLTNEEWNEHSSNSELRNTNYEQFYKYAEARDKAIADNLKKGIKKYKAKTSILVTGGFHSSGITRFLKSSEKSPTIISVTPKITKVESEKGTNYLSVFTQEKTPLEVLFEGEKLFLATNPFSAFVRNFLLPFNAATAQELRSSSTDIPQRVNQKTIRQLSRTPHHIQKADLRDRRQTVEGFVETKRGRFNFTAHKNPDGSINRVTADKTNPKQPSDSKGRQLVTGHADLVAPLSSNPWINLLSATRKILQESHHIVAAKLAFMEIDEINFEEGYVRAWANNRIQATVFLLADPLFNFIWASVPLILIYNFHLHFVVIIPLILLTVTFIIIGTYYSGQDWENFLKIWGLNGKLTLPSFITAFSGPTAKDGPNHFYRSDLIVAGNTSELGEKATRLGQYRQYLENFGLEKSIPDFFVISHQQADDITKEEHPFSQETRNLLESHLEYIGKDSGRALGDPTNPLFVAVRGSPLQFSPGQFVTVLNVGINDETLPGLEKRVKGRIPAYNLYAKLIGDFLMEVHGLSKEEITKLENTVPRKSKEILSLWKLRARKEIYERTQGRPFPQDPYEQMSMVMKAVQKEMRYTTPDKGYFDGGIMIQNMVFGVMSRSYAGEILSRDTETGERKTNGNMEPGVQGDSTKGTTRLGTRFFKDEPDAAELLEELIYRGEELFSDGVRLETTVEEGFPYVLQIRRLRESPQARAAIIMDLLDTQKIITDDAYAKGKEVDVRDLRFQRKLDNIEDLELIGKGIHVAYGVGTGRVAITPAAAKRFKEEGEDYILLRPEVRAKDRKAIRSSKGVISLIQVGNHTEHLALQAKVPGVLGIKYKEFDFEEGTATLIDASGNQIIIDEKDDVHLSIDLDGNVYLGEGHIIEVPRDLSPEVARFSSWIIRYEQGDPVYRVTRRSKQTIESRIPEGTVFKGDLVEQNISEEDYDALKDQIDENGEPVIHSIVRVFDKNENDEEKPIVRREIPGQVVTDLANRALENATERDIIGGRFAFFLWDGYDKIVHHAHLHYHPNGLLGYVPENYKYTNVKEANGQYIAEIYRRAEDAVAKAIFHTPGRHKDAAFAFRAGILKYIGEDAALRFLEKAFDYAKDKGLGEHMMARIFSNLILKKPSFARRAALNLKPEHKGHLLKELYYLYRGNIRKRGRMELANAIKVNKFLKASLVNSQFPYELDKYDDKDKTEKQKKIEIYEMFDQKAAEEQAAKEEKKENNNANLLRIEVESIYLLIAVHILGISGIVDGFLQATLAVTSGLELTSWFILMGIIIAVELVLVILVSPLIRDVAIANHEVPGHLRAAIQRRALPKELQTTAEAELEAYRSLYYLGEFRFYLRHMRLAPKGLSPYVVRDDNHLSPRQYYVPLAGTEEEQPDVVRAAPVQDLKMGIWAVSLGTILLVGGVLLSVFHIVPHIHHIDVFGPLVLIPGKVLLALGGVGLWAAPRVDKRALSRLRETTEAHEEKTTDEELIKRRQRIKENRPKMLEILKTRPPYQVRGKWNGKDYAMQGLWAMKVYLHGGGHSKTGNLSWQEFLALALANDPDVELDMTDLILKKLEENIRRSTDAQFHEKGPEGGLIADFFSETPDKLALEMLEKAIEDAGFEVGGLNMAFPETFHDMYSQLKDNKNFPRNENHPDRTFARSFYNGEGELIDLWDVSAKRKGRFFDLLLNWGWKPGVWTGLDVAASTLNDRWQRQENQENGEMYLYYKNPTLRQRSSAQMDEDYEDLLEDHALIWIEDIKGDDDLDGWRRFTGKHSHNLKTVGDDVFSTNPRLLENSFKTVEEKGSVATDTLLKPNQIGDLGEFMLAAKLSLDNGNQLVSSHRSGSGISIIEPMTGLGLNTFEMGLHKGQPTPLAWGAKWGLKASERYDKYLERNDMMRDFHAGNHPVAHPNARIRNIAPSTGRTGDGKPTVAAKLTLTTNESFKEAVPWGAPESAMKQEAVNLLDNFQTNTGVNYAISNFNDHIRPALMQEGVDLSEFTHVAMISRFLLGIELNMAVRELNKLAQLNVSTLEDGQQIVLNRAALTLFRQLALNRDLVTPTEFPDLISLFYENDFIADEFGNDLRVNIDPHVKVLLEKISDASRSILNGGFTDEEVEIIESGVTTKGQQIIEQRLTRQEIRLIKEAKAFLGGNTTLAASSVLTQAAASVQGVPLPIFIQRSRDDDQYLNAAFIYGFSSWEPTGTMKKVFEYDHLNGTFNWANEQGHAFKNAGLWATYSRGFSLGFGVNILPAILIFLFEGGLTLLTPEAIGISLAIGVLGGFISRSVFMTIHDHYGNEEIAYHLGFGQKAYLKGIQKIENRKRQNLDPGKVLTINLGLTKLHIWTQSEFLNNPNRKWLDIIVLTHELMPFESWGMALMVFPPAALLVGLLNLLFKWHSNNNAINKPVDLGLNEGTGVQSLTNMDNEPEQGLGSLKSNTDGSYQNGRKALRMVKEAA